MTGYGGKAEVVARAQNDVDDPERKWPASSVVRFASNTVIVTTYIIPNLGDGDSSSLAVVQGSDAKSLFDFN
jgi:hypothetical protein